MKESVSAERHLPDRCVYCGRFVSFADVAVYGKAVTRMVTPDSHFTRETYETYHKDCQDAAELKELGRHSCSLWSIPT